MSRTPIEERIALLLSKAESTTPAEAEALTAAAEKLMLRHGIEQAVIDARRTGSERRESITTAALHVSGIHAVGWTQLAQRIVNGLGGLKMIRVGKANTTKATLYVYGFESDVNRMVTLYTSLQQQATTAQRAWWRAHPMREWASRGRANQERRAFLFGFARVVGERLEAERAEAVAEQEDAAGTALVLADRSALVNAAFDVDWNPETIRQRRPRSTGSQSSADAGAEAGERASTGARAVANTRALTAV